MCLYTIIIQLQMTSEFLSTVMNHAFESCRECYTPLENTHCIVYIQQYDMSNINRMLHANKCYNTFYSRPHANQCNFWYATLLSRNSELCRDLYCIGFDLLLHDVHSA